MELIYQNGFGNHFQTEALENTLPQGQNSPQQVNHGLYAEQINGSAFTVARHQNLRSWMYRILPSVVHDRFLPAGIDLTFRASSPASPEQMRWSAIPYPQTSCNFVTGLIPFACNGDPAAHIGNSIFYFHVNQSMENDYFYSADGEFLIVIQEGHLLFKTEMGWLDIQPNEIIVIPRGIKFQVELLSDKARGYALENHGAPFGLPELGPIGANGLANPRDFQAPTAQFEDSEGDFTLSCKYQGHLYKANIASSPLDVVAWHGNYTPYKYDLRKFNAINSVSFDHCDPSIFTVLTSISTPGTANLDFVIFPERWVVAENTFRPPYYHRNVMNEFMGLVYGQYDAKGDDFEPGGASIHNCMSAHGPDSASFERFSTKPLKPSYYKGTLAFMFESRYPWQASEFALNCKERDQNYQDCWKTLQRHFKK